MQSFLNCVGEVLHEIVIAFQVKVGGSRPIVKPGRSGAELIRFIDVTWKDVGMQGMLRISQSLIIDQCCSSHFQKCIANNGHIL